MTSDTITDAMKRKGARASLFLSATISAESLKAPVTVRVRNLSEGGMMIDGNAKFVPDMTVTATLGGIGEISGRIAWTEAGRAGVAFDEQIDPKQARAPAPAGMAADLNLMKAPKVYDRRPGLRPR